MGTWARLTPRQVGHHPDLFSCHTLDSQPSSRTSALWSGGCHGCTFAQPCGKAPLTQSGALKRIRLLPVARNIQGMWRVGARECPDEKEWCTLKEINYIMCSTPPPNGATNQFTSDQTATPRIVGAPKSTEASPGNPLKLPHVCATLSGLQARRLSASRR